MIPLIIIPVPVLFIEVVVTGLELIIPYLTHVAVPAFLAVDIFDSVPVISAASYFAFAVNECAVIPLLLIVQYLFKKSVELVL